LAEPWVSVAKERVALRERKKRANAEPKKTALYSAYDDVPIFFCSFIGVRVQYCNPGFRQASTLGACRIRSRFRPEGPWELSPGFSLGGVIFYALALVRAPTMPGQSHIDPTQIQMTISSARSGLVAFIVTPDPG
jgi:hypothetical protein